MNKIKKYLQNRRIKLKEERNLHKSKAGRIDIEINKIDSMIRALENEK